MAISRRGFLKLALRGTLGASLGTLGGVTYVTKIEPESVGVTRVDVPLSHLPASFDGTTLAHISDLHLGDWLAADRWLSVIRQVNALRPDIVAITGDFVSAFDAGVAATITAGLNELRARKAILATLGNHDHWTDPAGVRRGVEAAGTTRLLLNEHVTIQNGSDVLYIAGVDDITEHREDLAAALNSIPENAPAVLLAHEPDYADTVGADGRVGLQLSGHSHGGQIRLPGVGAIILPPLSLKYDMGLFRIGDMWLYVNRGIGMVHPCIRFNCPPEITLLTLRQGAVKSAPGPARGPIETF